MIRRTAVTLLLLGHVGGLAAQQAWGFPEPQARRAREIMALADAGRSRDAEAAARAEGPRFRVTLGDLMVRRGELAMADSIYSAVVAEGRNDVRPALAGIAEIATMRGDRERAWRHALQLTDAYQRGGSTWSSVDMVAVGRAYALLGLGDPAATRAALAAFDEAARRDRDNLDAKILAGDLLLSKYNAPDARDTYLEVLKQVPLQSRALFGIARTMVFEGNPDATTAIRSSLDGNRELTQAWLLLGRLHLEAEAYDSAAAAAAHALAIDSTTSASWGLAGAIAWLRNDTTGYRRAEAAARRHQPRSADFYVEIGAAAARNRRYAEAVELGRSALTVDSLSVAAMDLLSANLLRQGTMGEGRELLDRSFRLNPYNLWNDNSLKLLDLLKTFRTVRTGRFEIVAHPGEIDYLVLYLAPLLESAYDQFAKRYDYQPPTPIRIEIYNRHAEFSVRTVAMPGLGALGVSFGNLLVLDSPGAREKGEFNYGSTSWHELAHTFTLGASGFRIPRWMSEGLSVLEERRTGRGWGANVTSGFLAAYKGGFLRPVSALNDGLVRPAYPMQIMHTYYQASLVCEMIEEMKGEAGIRAMLKGFRDGLDVAGVFRQTLNLTPAEMDTAFDSWMKKRFAAPLAVLAAGGVAEAPAGGAWADAVNKGVTLYQARQTGQALEAFQAADRLWPDYGGIDGPARWLARIHLDRGDTTKALAQLARVTSVVEDAMDLNQVEANLRLLLNDGPASMRTLERLQWIAPFDLTHHLQSAATYEAVRNWAMAVKERRAIVALNPPDRIEARYQLARVLAASGDTTAARREVLGVLEEAPAFEKAQTLLLQLRSTGGNQ